ncbi:MAG: hypothetical protein DI539_22645 [Flavobacterium psychrophilum]|nr:MAG: hypothetical protein DI539_22645 [Flavobacterium psychrophilum]
MKHLGVINPLLPVLLLVSSTILFGQKLTPKKRQLEPDTTIHSKVMGKEYQLYISFPKNYSTKDTVKYPVLYVLDGLYSFPAFKSIRESLDIDKELEDVIIVGIGCGLDFVSWGINRTNDYTPSQDTAWNRQYEKDAAKQYNLDYNSVKGKIHSGEARKFLQCITTEIIPYIETHYNTTTDRGISGFSLGGLFTAWCFLNTKGIFKKFGINSPSLWWNNNEVIVQAESLSNKNETLNIPPTKVFISVGEKETPVMISGMEKFSELLESKAYKNVSVAKQKLVGETHSSAMRTSLKRSISVLYGKQAEAKAAEIDFVKASPDKAKILLENEFVRVIEYSLKPGEKDNTHTHPPKTSYVISGGTLRVYPENEKPFDSEEIKGTTEWAGKRGKHYVENIGKTTVTILLTEIKSVH